MIHGLREWYLFMYQKTGKAMVIYWKVWDLSNLISMVQNTGWIMSSWTDLVFLPVAAVFCI